MHNCISADILPSGVCLLLSCECKWRVLSHFAHYQRHSHRACDQQFHSEEGGCRQEVSGVLLEELSSEPPVSLEECGGADFAPLKYLSTQIDDHSSRVGLKVEPKCHSDA
jgi:hypothetical protein